MNVVPFASQPRTLLRGETARGWRFVETSNDVLGGTNLEAALTSAVSVPSGYNPRVLLLSDGNENEGSAARAIAELQQLHVPVDSIPLAGRTGNALRLESLSMPHEAYSGEQIPIDLTIYSPRNLHANVELSADGKTIGGNPIDSGEGRNTPKRHVQ